MALITFLLILPTAYLLYVRLNKKKLKAIKKKHPSGSPNFETYQVLYSTRTLALLILLSALFVLDLLGNLYKNSQASGWASLLVFVSTLILLGLYIWWLSKERK